MDILLFTIVKSPEAAALTETTKNISKKGACIGRGKSNSWVLPDPDRYLSSIHTEILYRDGKFFAVDQSTNGTFYNGSAEQIGKGNEVELFDGDHLVIGDYEIEITLWPETEPVADGPFARIDSESVDYSSPNNADESIPVNHKPLPSSYNSVNSNTPGILQQEQNLDPLLAFSASEPIDEVFSPAVTQGDSENIMKHVMQFPEMIPDNWFDLPLPDLEEQVEVDKPAVTEMDFSAHSEHRNRLMGEIGLGRESLVSRTAESPQKIQESVSEDVPHPLHENPVPVNNKIDVNKAENSEEDSPGSVSISANEDLVAALGLNIQDLNDKQLSEINDVVGEFTKIAVKGLMLILKSRSSLKSEFRMNVTTIQSAENNPLKFSPTLEDAMFNMFVRGGNAYKDPVTAVKEGIEGIADHQFSVFAGMRSAFNFLLERFNPKILEAKFEKQKSSNILASKKAKNWELYASFYDELIKDRDDSFQYLFGDDFVQAYEQQMQQLQLNRSNNK